MTHHPDVMTADHDAAALAAVGHARGPCGLCGGRDARHRITDALADRFLAGDTAADLAMDYGIEPEAATTAVAHALAVRVLRTAPPPSWAWEWDRRHDLKVWDFTHDPDRPSLILETWDEQTAEYLTRLLPPTDAQQAWIAAHPDEWPREVPTA